MPWANDREARRRSSATYGRVPGSRVRCPCTLARMAAEEFNKEFWLATAAAAPVIGLAAAVTAQQIWDRAKKLAAEKGVPAGRSLGSTWYVVNINVAIQAVALAFALSSLSVHVDQIPRVLSGIFVVGGMFLVLWPLTLAPGIESRRRARDPKPQAEADDAVE